MVTYAFYISPRYFWRVIINNDSVKFEVVQPWLSR